MLLLIRNAIESGKANLTNIGVASDGTIVCMCCKNRSGKCSPWVVASAKDGTAWGYCSKYKATATQANNWNGDVPPGCFKMIHQGLCTWVAEHAREISAKVAEKERRALLAARLSPARASPARAAPGGVTASAGVKRRREPVRPEDEDDI